jgi:LysR family nitrogen assimilation transcriptional regulator
VTLKVVEGFSPQLLDALLTGRLDLAVMTNPPRTTVLQATPLTSEPLLVLAPPGTRGTRQAFSLTELCRTPLIITAGIRTLVDQQLAGYGGGLAIDAIVDSVEAIRRLLLSGTGMTIMPVSTFHDEIRDGRLAAYPVEDANLHRLLILSRPIAKGRSAGIDEMEHIVRDEMTKLMRQGLFRMPAPVAPSPASTQAAKKSKKAARRRRH